MKIQMVIRASSSRWINFQMHREPGASRTRCIQLLAAVQSRCFMVEYPVEHGVEENPIGCHDTSGVVARRFHAKLF
jgi:hypothetical protein